MNGIVGEAPKTRQGARKTLKAFASLCYKRLRFIITPIITKGYTAAKIFHPKPAGILLYGEPVRPF